MKVVNLFAVCLVLLSAIACTKSDSESSLKGEVEVYLIKSYNEIDTSDVIDVNSVVLEKNPLLEYDDLLSYNNSTYTFNIIESKWDLFAMGESTIHFKTFAVTVDNEIIYTGYIWPSYSSRGINWVVADPLMVEMSGRFTVALGYPGMLNNVVIPDKRNDSRILNIFKRDNKLVD